MLGLSLLRLQFVVGVNTGQLILNEKGGTFLSLSRFWSLSLCVSLLASLSANPVFIAFGGD